MVLPSEWVRGQPQGGSMIYGLTQWMGKGPAVKQQHQHDICFTQWMGEGLGTRQQQQ